MTSTDQSPFVIAVAGPSGAGKSTLVKEVAQLLENAVTFYFDDYSEYPEDIAGWVAQGADPGQWLTPHLVADLRTLKAGQPITLSALARRHRAAVGEKEIGEMLRPARFIIVDEPFGRERPGMAELIDFVVGLNVPLDIALARKLLRDIAYYQKGIFTGDLIEHIKSSLQSYPSLSRAIYLAACRTVIEHSDLLVDGTKPAQQLAGEIVDKINTGRLQAGSSK